MARRKRQGNEHMVWAGVFMNPLKEIKEGIIIQEMLSEFTIFPRNNPIYLPIRNTHDIMLCKKTSPAYGKLKMYILDQKGFITIFLKIGF